MQRCATITETRRVPVQAGKSVTVDFAATPSSPPARPDSLPANNSKEKTSPEQEANDRDPQMRELRLDVRDAIAEVRRLARESKGLDNELNSLRKAVGMEQYGATNFTQAFLELLDRDAASIEAASADKLKELAQSIQRLKKPLEQIIEFQQALMINLERMRLGLAPFTGVRLAQQLEMISKPVSDFRDAMADLDRTYIDLKYAETLVELANAQINSANIKVKYAVGDVKKAEAKVQLIEAQIALLSAKREVIHAEIEIANRQQALGRAGKAVAQARLKPLFPPEKPEEEDPVARAEAIQRAEDNRAAANWALGAFDLGPEYAQKIKPKLKAAHHGHREAELNQGHREFHFYPRQ